MLARISRGGTVSASCLGVLPVTSPLARTRTSGRRSGSSLWRTSQPHHASRGIRRHASAQRMGEAKVSMSPGDSAMSGGVEHRLEEEDVAAAKKLLQALSRYRPQGPTER